MTLPPREHANPEAVQVLPPKVERRWFGLIVRDGDTSMRVQHRFDDGRWYCHRCDTNGRDLDGPLVEVLPDGHPLFAKVVALKGG
jgi:hypothetical protein